MPDLLIELFSEEIPARMQRRAADDLRKLVTDALVERGFLYEGAKAFATPRRLALHVAGLPLKGRDVREERKGPRVGAPEAALQGFLKSAGLASVDGLQVQSDPKKGEFYVALIERPGRATTEVLAEILPDIVRGFPWPKSMRWGRASAQPGALRWVRPLHSIVCTFGPETEDPEVVRFEVDGVLSGDETRGHRFMAPDLFRVKRLDDYATGLERARVVLDADRRKDMILHDARDLAFAQGLELVEDEALLEEVAGLVEWPVVLLGSFDERFLEIPAEVIRATIRANQKCFVLRGPGGALSNRFVLVSNIQASDGGKAIVAGNERVVRARLSDALYFWETDQRPLPDFPEPQGKPLDQRLAKLKSLGIVFHEKLGTQGERIERIRGLAREIAPLVGADPALADRAAELAKADLVTEVVGEFPETQGLMGRRYAELQGEHPSVAAAIEDHYKPLGPSDRVPTDPVAVAVALADKIDTLVGFWAIDEKPTGSKDPYALRRAALGVIRLVLENGVRLPVERIIASALKGFEDPRDPGWISVRDGGSRTPAGQYPAVSSTHKSRRLLEDVFQEVRPDLLSFLTDRLKVYLKDRGARHDLIDAVLAAAASPSPRVSGGEGLGVGGLDPRDGAFGRDEASMGARASESADEVGSPPTPSPSPPQAGGGGQDDLLMIVRRVEALGRFLDTEDGKNLLAGYKRAANILRIEEKKEGAAFDGAPDLALVQEAGQIEEKALVVALNQATQEARAAVEAEDFEGAMRALSRLRAPVDAFFEKVTVNAEEPAVRRNRLQLLNAIRAATREVADFGRIES